MSFHTVLIANRGEIARRVIRTCHARGLATVAVFTDIDAGAPFVREADRAVRIGPPTAYLDGAAVLAAAAKSGADAIHPGYGFLAENASFAASVQASGLVWIGPSPAAMRALGDKSAARTLARQIGVPTLDGYDGDDRAAMREAAVRIGFPVLIKAAAGGGGRGMRRVDDADALDEALAAAEREALASFGDGRLLLERLVLRPRHIEVQILGDHHGNVIHLGERECSLQRRHQKVVEEAPAVDAALRERLGDAAIALARAARYDNAGTVEFLVDEHGSFTLLELNARLQVEHPVTEAITGLDLVALQLHVAAGHPLPLTQADVRFVGHAIEVRICAEDPARDFAPATGTLVRVDLPDELRVDTGVEAGSVVSPHYDSMLAKVIAFAPDRETATARLRRGLTRAWLPGLATNLPLLRDALAAPAWAARDLHTGFFAANGLPRPAPIDLPRAALAGAVRLALSAPGRIDGVPAAFRTGGAAWVTDRWTFGADTVTAAWRASGAGYEVRVGDRVHAVSVHATDGDAVRVEVDGVIATWRITEAPADGDALYVHFGDAEMMAVLEPRFPVPVVAEDPGTCSAPGPGKVVAVRVVVGDGVEKGQALVVIEAMKMELTITAPAAGTIAEVRVETGDSVAAGDVLVRLTSDPAET